MRPAVDDVTSPGVLRRVVHRHLWVDRRHRRAKLVNQSAVLSGHRVVGRNEDPAFVAVFGGESREKILIFAPVEIDL